MASKYINNGTYAATGYNLSGAYSGITIGSAGTIGGSGLIGGYTGSYTIVNHGHITGTYVAIALTQVSTVTNTGLIEGGAGSSFGIFMVDGGSVSNSSTGLIEGSNGIAVEGSATITNAGTILAVGTSPGIGISLYVGGSVTNASGALIKGGSGVLIGSAPNSPGVGFVTNAGTIESTAASGSLAVGVQLGGGGSVINSAKSSLIEGAIGVEVAGAATVTNAGTIASTVGSKGTAVLFQSASDVLVVDPGATFVGNAIGDGGTLAMAGAGGTLSGLGTSFTGFDTIETLLGSRWTLTGGNKIGTSAADILLDDGSLTVKGVSTLTGTIGGTGTLLLSGVNTILPGGVLTVASLDLTGGDLTSLPGLDLVYQGNFAQTGGTIALAGSSLELLGTSSLAGGTVSGSGSLESFGGSTSLTRLTLERGAGWQVFGTATSTGALVFGSAAAGLTVEAGGVFDITGLSGIALASGGGGTIDNAGLLEKTVNPGVTTIAPSITDTGTVTIAAGTLNFIGATNTFAGPINGAGALQFGGGSSTIANGTSLSVAQIVLAGTNTQLTLAASLPYAGSFTQSGGTLNLGSTDLTLSGAANLAGSITGAGTLTLAGTETLATGAVLAVGHLTESGGSVTLTKNLTYNGSFAQSAGPIKVAGYTLVLNGTATLTNGAMSGAGFVATYGAVSLVNYTINAGAVWQVYGKTTATGSVTLGNGGGGSGRIAVEAGGLYDITANGGIVVAPGGSGTVGNFALFEKTGGTGISTIAAAFTNSGNIIANAGALDFAGAVTGAGVENIGSAGVLRFDSSVAATQSIAFSSTAGGRLALNDPSGNGLAFAATVSGFGGADQLDLTTFAFSGNPTIGWSQTSSSSGVLSVTDGSKIAQIALFGQFSQSGFATAKDGGTGTTVTYTAPTQVVLAPPHH